MNSTRCAVCKYFRRKCDSDCIFLPHFPPNNPQRFACIHRIYGASNIKKMLEQLPVNLRADAVESLYYEAKCRIQDPVYGCVGIISLLHQQISNVQSQLTKAQAEIAFHNAESINNSLAAEHRRQVGPEDLRYQPQQQPGAYETVPSSSFVPELDQINLDGQEYPYTSWFC